MQTVQLAGAAAPSPTSTFEDCLVAFCRAPQQFLLDRARTHGPVSLYRLGDEIFATVSDPEIAHAVFHGAMNDFEKGPITDPVRPIFGLGPLTADGEQWMSQARAISPMFARHRIRRLIDTTHGLVDRQIDRWRSRGDHADDGALRALKGLAFDVVAVTLLSLHDEQERADLFDVMYHVDRVPTLSLHYRAKGLPLDRLSGIVSTGAETLVGRIARTNDLLYAIADKRLAMAEQPEDVIGAVLASPAALALPLERRRLLLRDLIASMLSAGFVSTGESMYWALYHLARDAGVQARAREEVLAANGRLVEAPPYLLAVINESMRLYPPAWYIGRTTRRPMELGGVHIPVGTQVVCSPFVLQRSPALWPNPDTFSPERFLPGSSIVPRSFIPFSTGQRSCIGRSMAMMEQTSLLSGVLAAFDLEIAEGPDVVTLTCSFSMQPRDRISIRFRPRS